MIKFWTIFQQLSHVPEIDPSPFVFFAWPLPAHSRAGLLCSSTTPTFVSLRRWTNVLFPKSEIHLQLVSLPPTQIKGVLSSARAKVAEFLLLQRLFWNQPDTVWIITWVSQQFPHWLSYHTSHSTSPSLVVSCGFWWACLTSPPLSFRPRMLGCSDSPITASSGSSRPVLAGTLYRTTGTGLLSATCAWDTCESDWSTFTFPLMLLAKVKHHSSLDQPNGTSVAATVARHIGVTHLPYCVQMGVPDPPWWNAAPELDCSSFPCRSRVWLPVRHQRQQQPSSVWAGWWL